MYAAVKIKERKKANARCDCYFGYWTTKNFNVAVMFYAAAALSCVQVVVLRICCCWSSACCC